MTTEQASIAGKGKNGASTALAKAAPPTSILAGGLTIKQLDSKVAKILELKGTGAVSQWEIGKLVRELRETGAWKLRMKEGEKQAYRSMDAFCHTELHMTPTYAYQLSDVASVYTAEQVRELGVTKLGFTVSLPAEERAKVLESHIKQGASKKEVAAEVRRVKKEKGIGPRTGVSSATGKAMPKGKAPKMKMLTVANILGNETVKLFAKPDKVKDFDAKTAKRAKRLADVPWGTLELSNGVVQTFTVQESATGEWVLKVSTTRQED